MVVGRLFELCFVMRWFMVDVVIRVSYSLGFMGFGLGFFMKVNDEFVYGRWVLFGVVLF